MKKINHKMKDAIRMWWWMNKVWVQIFVGIPLFGILLLASGCYIKFLLEPNKVVCTVENTIVYEGRSCFMGIDGAGTYATLSIYKFPGIYKIAQYTGNTIEVSPSETK